MLRRPTSLRRNIDYYEALPARTDNLPTAAFVLAIEEFSFRVVLT